jgi:hypothetical protein
MKRTYVFLVILRINNGSFSEVHETTFFFVTDSGVAVLQCYTFCRQVICVWNK